MSTKTQKPKVLSTIDLIILGILHDTPLSAYELAQFVEFKKIDRLLKISKPAIYKNCKRLYKSGFINGKTVREGESPEKVIYSMNKNGKKYFHTLMQHYSMDVRPFYFEHNSFLWNIEKLDKEQGLIMLKDLQTSLISLTDWIVTHEKEVRKNGTFAAKAVVRQYRMILETMVKWIEETIKDYKKID